MDNYMAKKGLNQAKVSEINLLKQLGWVGLKGLFPCCITRGLLLCLPLIPPFPSTNLFQTDSPWLTTAAIRSHWHPHCLCPSLNPGPCPVQSPLLSPPSPFSTPMHEWSPAFPVSDETLSIQALTCSLHTNCLICKMLTGFSVFNFILLPSFTCLSLCLWSQDAHALLITFSAHTAVSRIGGCDRLCLSNHLLQNHSSYCTLSYDSHLTRLRECRRCKDQTLRFMIFDMKLQAWRCSLNTPLCSRSSTVGGVPPTPAARCSLTGGSIWPKGSTLPDATSSLSWGNPVVAQSISELASARGSQGTLVPLVI